MKLTQTQRDNYLRIFWFLLALSLIAGAVALFEARNAGRDKAISKKALNILNITVEEHPDTQVALQALMECVRKGYLKIDNSSDENDINQSKQLCPAYGAALEATYASPVGMHELSEGYRKFVIGMKSI